MERKLDQMDVKVDKLVTGRAVHEVRIKALEDENKTSRARWWTVVTLLLGAVATSVWNATTGKP
jgi:hypothetical protein